MAGTGQPRISGIFIGVGLALLAVFAVWAVAQRSGGIRYAAIIEYKIWRLNTRDAAAEARAAASHGDFRLGGNQYSGDPIPEANGWHTPGVNCALWSRDLIGKWIGHTDVIRPLETQHGKAAEAFLSRYNAAMVMDPRFPWRDICHVNGSQDEAAYKGPVTDFPSAARSGKIEALKGLKATPEALNTPDVLGVTGMGWAMWRKDRAMAEALMALGADANDLGDVDANTLLADALLRGDDADTKRLIAAGVAAYGETGLCKKVEMPSMISVANLPPENVEALPSPGHCSWGGYLIEHGKLDLLDDLMASRPKMPEGPGEAVDARNEIEGYFYRALEDHNNALARRLFRYVDDMDGDDYPGAFLLWLHRHNHDDLMAERIFNGDIKFARSPYEAKLWRLTLNSHRYESFALLFDFGQMTNWLKASDQAVCEAAISGGDTATVAQACVRRSFARKTELDAMIRAGDVSDVKTRLAQAASLKEDYKSPLVVDIVRNGTPAMLDVALAMGASRAAPHRTEQFIDQHHGHAAVTEFYQGPLRKDLLDLVAKGTAFEMVSILESQDAMGAAIARGDVAMLQALAAHGYTGMSEALFRHLNFGNGLDTSIPGYVSMALAGEDSEKYPNRPDAATFAYLQRVIPVIAKSEGPQTLEPILSHAVQYGWNDVVQLILDNGFDLKLAKHPFAVPSGIWSEWAIFESTCKPSTAQLLIKNGLRAKKTTSDNSEDWNLPEMVIATCRNPNSLRAVIEGGRLDVNAPGAGAGGGTLLDFATTYHNEAAIKTLKAMGGKFGRTIAPLKAAAKKKTARQAGYDPDLVASEDLGL